MNASKLATAIFLSLLFLEVGCQSNSSDFSKKESHSVGKPGSLQLSAQHLDLDSITGYRIESARTIKKLTVKFVEERPKQEILAPRHAFEFSPVRTFRWGSSGGNQQFDPPIHDFLIHDLPYLFGSAHREALQKPNIGFNQSILGIGRFYELLNKPNFILQELNKQHFDFSPMSQIALNKTKQVTPVSEETVAKTKQLDGSKAVTKLRSSHELQRQHILYQRAARGVKWFKSGQPLELRFAQIPEGKYFIGGEFGLGRCKPIQSKAFAIAKSEITNTQFANFVAATGYLTDAERNGWAWVSRVKRVGENEELRWSKVQKANWRRPMGPKGIHAKDYPNNSVVQVSPADARAFARWLGVRLPYGYEWEIATRLTLKKQTIDESEQTLYNNFKLGEKWNYPQTIVKNYVYAYQSISIRFSRKALLPFSGLCDGVSEICEDIGIQRLKNDRGRQFALIRGPSWFEQIQGHKSYGPELFPENLNNTVTHLNFVDYMPFYQGKANVGFRVAMDLK